MRAMVSSSPPPRPGTPARLAPAAAIGNEHGARMMDLDPGPLGRLLRPLGEKQAEAGEQRACRIALPCVFSCGGHPCRAWGTASAVKGVKGDDEL